MSPWVAIFLGGGLGSVSRYGVGQIVLKYLGKTFPYGTLTANILSCVVLGLVLTMPWKAEQESWKMLLVVGFCGGFSTFSTFSFETVELLKNGVVWPAVLNIVISVVVCVGILLIMLRNT